MKRTITFFAQNSAFLHSKPNALFSPNAPLYFQKIKKYRSAILLFAFFLTINLPDAKLKAQAYCTMACNTSVNVSLPQACEAEILYDMILEGTYTSSTCSPNGPSAFVVTVMGPTGAPIPSSPFVNSTHVGQYLNVKVKHWASGNNCWGQIQVEDKLAPQLTCPANVTVECTESTSVSATGEATAADCSEFTLSHYDNTQNFGCNSNSAGQVTRTWTAEDIHSNTSTCQQQITIAQPNTNDIEWPTNLDDISAPSLDCTNPNTQPSNTGEPSISGEPIPNGSGFCSMAIDYDDLTLTLCENSFKILRTWTVVYWCTGAIINHTQVIAVKDKTPPVLTCPPPLTVGTTSSTTCKATVILPPTGITDDCSTTFNVNMNTPVGLVSGNGGVIHNVNTGTFALTYNVQDDCSNSASCSTQLTVVDDDSPTVICDEFTVTTLNNSGIAIVFAQTFDDGTYDNCGPFDLEARRMVAACGNAPVFAPMVTFCCEDVGEDVQVEMRATDYSGNSNSCMVIVHVDDNSEPAILCPGTVTLTCLQDPTDLNLTGEPTTVLACGTANINYTDVDNRNQCDVGEIIRTWTVTAGNGNSNSCNQTITTVDNTPVIIDFPDDYAVTGCVSIDDLQPGNLPPGFDFPVVTSDCEMIATNIDDQVFTVAAPACFKIVRTWTLIDWCTYQVGGNTGIWSHSQIIMVTDNTPPTFTCPDNMTIGVDVDCQASVVLPQITDIQDCSMDVDVFVSSTLGFGSGPFNNVDLGNYTATYTVADGCGNTTACTIDIDVIDDKKPTPYCKTGIVIELMGVDTDGDGLIDNGMAVTWAEDFDLGSTDNCPGNLKFSFSANINDVGAEFDCSNIGQNVVNIWVTDAAGNQDFCQTVVIIQDNMGVCSGNYFASVGGAITNENGLDVENVMVNINDGVTPPAMTGSNGNFEFPVLPLSNDFTVTPEKDTNLLNGVSTYDIVLIRKHVLGEEFLDSPYKIIAADINRSNSISTADMVALQKTILHVTDEFPNNESWRFIDADYVFPDSLNPFQETFPEIYNINNFQGNMAEVDFIATKVGDVNGSAVLNMLTAAPDDRSGDLLTLKAQDEFLQASEEYRLDFTAENFEQIVGYQFTLNFDPSTLEYIRVENGDLPSLTESNFGFALLHQGAITTSWNNFEPASLQPEEVLFSMVFRARTNTNWAKAIDLGSTYTTAEAYYDGGELLDINLVFDELLLTESPAFSVKISPNPFRKTTVIGFTLPQAQEVALTVFDLSGRVVETVRANFPEGEAAYEFRADEKMQAGSYIYQLKTADNCKSGKMILVE